MFEYVECTKAIVGELVLHSLEEPRALDALHHVTRNVGHHDFFHGLGQRLQSWAQVVPIFDDREQMVHHEINHAVVGHTGAIWGFTFSHG